MANTYAKIETKDEFDDMKTSMKLSLTAFMGNNKHTQITIQTTSTIPFENGTAYITLGDKEVDLLIAALLERKLKIISATDCEQSVFCPYEEEL